MLKRLIVICVLGTLAFLFVSPTPYVAGQSGRENWSLPVILDDGWWQSITTDVQGTTYLAWYGSREDDTGQHDVLKYSYLPVNGEWQPPGEVVYTGDGGFTVRNGITTTADGQLFAALRYGTYHVYTSTYVVGSLNAANWAPVKPIDNTGYYIDLMADRNNILHLAYDTRLDTNTPLGGGKVEASICGFCHDLYYRRSTDEGKTWSDPVPLSVLPDTGSDRMDIREGPSGRLYIDWDEGLDWYVGRGSAQDVRIVYSDDGGLTWSDPIILDGGGFPDKHPIQLAMTETRDKSIVAVWRYMPDGERRIYYQVSSDSGVTWTPPTPIDGLIARPINDTPLDDYELITDKLGIVHLFVVGVTNGSTTDKGTNPTLYHLTFQQGIWSRPYPVFYSRDYWPEWPKATVGIQNDIHLSWFSRGIREGEKPKSNTDILKVFYSHLPGSFDLAATPTFEPTQTPLPTLTPFLQAFEATPTPVSTLENKTESALYLATQDVYAIQTLLGGILAAGLFCVIIFVIFRFFNQSR